MGFTIAGVSAATAASLAGTAVSAGVGAIGAINSASAQSANARYQAQVAANNATTANNNANLAQQQAAAKVQTDYRAGAIRLGAQRAALGANGGQLDSGSADDVQTTTARYSQLGVQNEIYQGGLTGYSYQNQATNFAAQSQLDSAAASNDAAAGGLGAAGSLITGASQFASKWNAYGGYSGIFGSSTGTNTGVGIGAGVWGLY